MSRRKVGALALIVTQKIAMKAVGHDAEIEALKREKDSLP